MNIRTIVIMKDAVREYESIVDAQGGYNYDVPQCLSYVKATCEVTECEIDMLRGLLENLWESGDTQYTIDDNPYCVQNEIDELIQEYYIPQ